MENATKQFGDAYGAGFMDFMNGVIEATFTVYSNIVETDDLPVSYFFRGWDELPEIEKVALNRTKGDVLDVGAGVGTHALILQERGVNVTAIDTSQGAVEVMKKRGIAQAFCQDFYQISGKKYNTILLLMNGLGIVGKLDNLDNFLNHLKTVLAPDGSVLVDSSDLIYLYEDEEDGGYLIDLNSSYYGEIEYRIDYKDIKGSPFDWIFVDPQTFQAAAERAGFSFEIIHEAENFHYLAKLTVAV